MSDQLPHGVALRLLLPHEDARGIVCELHRDSWQSGPRPVQWNAVWSRPGTLRGFHCHLEHSDRLVVIQGKMELGLRDLRPDAVSFGRTARVMLEGDRPTLVAIPPGVGHAFFFPEPAIHVYALDHGWDLSDELGCRWDDPELGIPWTIDQPLLSDRDRTAPAFAHMAGVVAGRRRMGPAAC